MVAKEFNTVDNHPIHEVEPEGEAWLSTIIPMATMHQLIYIPPLIGQWLLSTETRLFKHRNKFNFDSDKKKSFILNNLLNSLTEEISCNC